MAKTYFGFYMSDDMFNGDCTIKRRAIDVDEVRKLSRTGAFTPFLDIYDLVFIDAMRSRFNINIDIPEIPPLIGLSQGDSIIVMDVWGLPGGRKYYNEEEVASATFRFWMYTVV